MLSGFLAGDITPFADIPLWAVIGVFASHFFGFFIRGALGFGSNMPIVLLTTWLLGPHHAILLVVLTAFVAQIHLFPHNDGSVRAFARHKTVADPRHPAIRGAC